MATDPTPGHRCPWGLSALDAASRHRAQIQVITSQLYSHISHAPGPRLSDRPRSQSPGNSPWLPAWPGQEAPLSTPSCFLLLEVPPETASSARAAKWSQSPSKKLPVGAHHPLCPQTRPSSTSGPQCQLCWILGPRPPCPRAQPRGPGSPNSWAAWGPHRHSSGDGTVLPSSPSMRCHWLREGARGRFSGSCTLGSEGKGSAQAHSLRGLPAPCARPLPLQPPRSSPRLALAALAARPGLRHAFCFSCCLGLESRSPDTSGRQTLTSQVLGPTSPPL